MRLPPTFPRGKVNPGVIPHRRESAPVHLIERLNMPGALRADMGDTR
jgi:hypothetical protein